MARPRANDFEDKKRSILASAAAVFAAQGMEKASMAQIAQHAGVSKALLYHYYPSKEALIFAIIHTHLAALDEALATADDASLSPPLRLRRLIGVILEKYRGADDAHKVQLNALAALPPERRAEITAIERRIVQRVAAVLATLHPPLAAPGRHLLTPVTMSLFGMLNWVYTWFRDDGPLSREAYAEIVTRLMLEGVRAIG
jgi:AcrR family transcriptional regulator